MSQDAEPSELIVRTSGPVSAGMMREIERLLRQQMPSMASSYSRRMATALEPQLRPWRLGATLFMWFAGLAVVVAAVGIYAVVAYAVSQRTHEMGVRLALGARARDILDIAMLDGMRAVLVGVGAGIALSFAFGRLIASFLFGITPTDPSVLIGTAALLCGLGIVASAVPGWRAARINPLVALRAD
jgi:putative ABC transport system permease protein